VPAHEVTASDPAGRHMRLEKVTEREHCYPSVTSSRAYTFPGGGHSSSSAPPGNMCTVMVLSPV
jgi:hypothetical protein